MRNFVNKLRLLLKHPTHSRTLTILVALVIVATVPLTVYIAQKSQDIRQRASCTPVCLEEGPTCRPCDGDHRGDAGCNCRLTCRPCTGDNANDAGCNEGTNNGEDICDGPEICPSEVCDGPNTCIRSEQRCTPDPTSVPTSVPPTAVPPTTAPPTTAPPNPTSVPPTSGPDGRQCVQCSNGQIETTTQSCNSSTPNCENLVGTNGLCKATVTSGSCGNNTTQPTTPPVVNTATPIPPTGPVTPTVATPTTPPNFDAADVDRNGCIGRSDYLTWRSAYTTGVIRQNTFPDINTDNTVDLIDYNLWYNAMLSSSNVCRGG
ncbi:MAG: hypothetical protein A3G13_00250 [Candidatus Levybacteria bacterium RIFCSPLOWO2_12_FULL_37_7]|nr:MAG: hypothetical protein A3G13_00250 [Candidatus Levybacteria bacterium RIFCSPLOWO2_12_FULL_37_7]